MNIGDEVRLLVLFVEQDSYYYNELAVVKHISRVNEFPFELEVKRLSSEVIRTFEDHFRITEIRNV